MIVRILAVFLSMLAACAPRSQSASTQAAPLAPAGAATPAFAQTAQAPTRRPDVIFVPTPQEVVDAMLEVANVTKNDLVYDLGCGNGIIPITAAQKYGARAVCVDIDPDRIAEITKNVKEAKVEDRVKIVHGDLFEQDLSPATVVTLYLLPSLNEKLMPKLKKELKPGTRIVSHAFPMGDWKPDKEVDVNLRKVYFWTIPR